jgi:hypothetical protein
VDPHWFQCGYGSNILADADPGFEHLKNPNLKKIQMEIFLIFFDQKLQFSYLKASIKDFQATREVFIHQKRTCSTANFEISLLLWVVFALLDSNPDPADPNECGSGSTILIQI